jgi:hypothetical protein
VFDIPGNQACFVLPGSAGNERIDWCQALVTVILQQDPGTAGDTRVDRNDRKKRQQFLGYLTALLIPHTPTRKQRHFCYRGNHGLGPASENGFQKARGRWITSEMIDQNTGIKK